MWTIEFKRVTKPEQPVLETLPPTPKQTYVNLDPLRGAGKYMSHQFNAYCSELGVQCTVTMDPKDFRRLFHFRVTGDNDIRFEYDHQVRFLSPGEWVSIKVKENLYGEPEIPRISVMPHGNY